MQRVVSIVFLNVILMAACTPEQRNAEPPAAPEGVVDAGTERVPLDLNSPIDNVTAWRKLRGSLDPNEEVVFYWSGFVYPSVPADPAGYPAPGPPSFEEPLFKFEGFNIARFAEDGAGGHMMLSREAAFYEDINTGEIIDCWANPLDGGKRVSVSHVWNDPVNFGVGPVPFQEQGDRVMFYSDIVLAYRSPLAGVAALAPYSAGDVYQSAEMFSFFAARADLENPALKTVPVELSWNRQGQFLPWMQMGDRAGGLLYSVRGWKLAGGYADLPEHIRNRVEQSGRTEFQHTPTEFTRPNATSWRFFKSEFEAGRYQPTCP